LICGTKKGEKKGMEKKRITQFQRGSKLFNSTGISRVKVTVEGEVQCLEIPIKSTGVSELIDSFQKQAPTPPTIDVKATPDSDIGKSLGLTRNEWVKVFDTTDKGYLEAKANHDSNLGLKILMKGMDVEILDETGKKIEKDDDGIAVLKEMGLSGEQFSQIVGDITALTKWTEEEQIRFLVL